MVHSEHSVTSVGSRATVLGQLSTCVLPKCLLVQKRLTSSVGSTGPSGQLQPSDVQQCTFIEGITSEVSMQPTLLDGEVLVCHTRLAQHNYERGSST